MAGIAGRGTTYNLPNYHGELIELSRSDTPFLAAIGGITGGIRTVAATEFEWSAYDLRAPDATRQRREGEDAPAAAARVRSNITNVVEIHQETVDISYSKLGATQQHGGANIDAASATPADEYVWQVDQQVKQVAMDVNASFLLGTYQKPTDNTTVRRTRGLLDAIRTNVVAAAGADLTEDMVLDLMQMIYDAGGIREGETRTLMSNSTPKRALTKIFITDKGYRETSREVGGVHVTSIETDFGNLNIMLEPTLPQTAIVVASLEKCRPVGLEIPRKGVFFVEPLAKTGASERGQLYGEFGLEYGSERQHGAITGLRAA